VADAAGGGRAAQVVGEAESRVLDLPLVSLLLQLLVDLVHHPQAARADGVAEALEAAVGVDRQSAV